MSNNPFSECYGKRPFGTKKAAKESIRRGAFPGKRDSRGSLKAYKCSFCRYFHIGHRNGQ